MQILLHADPQTDGSQPMAQHLKTVLTDALARFGERITRVEAHLSDANGRAKTGGDDIHCTLDARLVGLPDVVVKEQAQSAHQAIDGAARKLQRAVGVALAKHDPRGHRVPHDQVKPGSEAELQADQTAGEQLAERSGQQDAADANDALTHPTSKKEPL
jgi:ribosome-associated translation inhibitor RaiA